MNWGTSRRWPRSAGWGEAQLGVVWFFHFLFPAPPSSQCRPDTARGAGTSSHGAAPTSGVNSKFRSSPALLLTSYKPGGPHNPPQGSPQPASALRICQSGSGFPVPEGTGAAQRRRRGPVTWGGPAPKLPGLPPAWRGVGREFQPSGLPAAALAASCHPEASSGSRLPA